VNGHSIFLILLAGAGAFVSVKLWLHNESLIGELEYKNGILERYATEAQLHAEQRALCLSAADGGLPELVNCTDPRCSPLYRSILKQRQLVEEFEALAVNRGATVQERYAVRQRVAEAVRRVIDRC
jgi:hypothetical protein